MTAGLIKTMLHVFALFPLPVVQSLAAGVAILLRILPNDLRRITRINIDLCFADLDASQRQQLVKCSLAEAVKTAFELGPVWLYNTRRFNALIHRVTGRELLDQAVAAGQGVILVAPHLGMWETMGLYVSMHYPITSLYRPSRIPALDSFMTQGRSRFGAKLAPTDAAGVRSVYKALARGEIVGVLPDQEPRWGNGVFAPFFGINAYTMTLLPRLAARSGAQVMLVWAQRLSAGRGYDLHFELLSGERFRADSQQAAEYLNQVIESKVRQLPAQYQWSYRRFRTAPENRKYSYYGRGR